MAAVFLASSPTRFHRLFLLTGILTVALSAQPVATALTERTDAPPRETGLRSKPDAPKISKELNPDQRADILMARKMYRAAADFYQEGIAGIASERAELLRLAATSYRESSRPAEAKTAESEARELDKKSKELTDKQQYLPGSGSNFFTRLLAALGLVKDSPPVPQDTTPAKLPSEVAAQYQDLVKMPEGLSLREQADFLASHGQHQQAADVYSSIERQMQRRQAVLWNKIGIAYHQMLDFPAASRCYREAIRTDGLYSEARNNLGTVHYAQKQYNRAIDEYKKSLDVTPYSASVHSNLGTAYFAKKDYELASVHYSRAVELDPQIFEHQGTQGTILQQRAVEDRANFHFYLSKVYARKGDFERSLLYMRKALEEGFKDRKKFVEDEDFAGLQQVPEFQTLLATEFRVL